jgi:hypothetical protein
LQSKYCIHAIFQLKENVGYEYETAEKTDLAVMGDYDGLDEEGRYNDTVESGNSDTFNTQQ